MASEFNYAIAISLRFALVQNCFRLMTHPTLKLLMGYVIRRRLHSTQVNKALK